MGDTSTLTGVLAALSAAFSFALWNIFLQRGLAAGAPARLALLTLAAAEVACFVPPALLLAWHGDLPPLHPRGLAWFLLAGVLTTVIGTGLATQATRRLGAAETTAIRLLDPFFAFVIAAIFLRERVPARALLGIALLVAALLLLQGRPGGRSATGQRPQRAQGLAFAVLTSLAFTVGSVVRKAGLTLIPSAIVAAAAEGIAGIVVIGAIIALRGEGGGLRALRSPAARDLWRSGLAAAAGTFFLNVALQRASVPVAVALRNTSPWFTLLLVPLLLGTQHRATRRMWCSTALLTVGMLCIVLR